MSQPSTFWTRISRTSALVANRIQDHFRQTRRRSNRRNSAVPLAVEVLEDRTLLASFTVDTLVDENDGVGTGGVSLRDAIAAAGDGDDITFSVQGTINLTNGELVIDKGLSIDGEMNNIVIDAGGNSRVFNVDDGNAGNQAVVAISNLSVTGGTTTQRGGGISNFENLMLTNLTVMNNSAGIFGGGIYNANGTLTVTGSTLSGNSGNNGGGGIFNLADGGMTSTVTVIDSTISANTVGSFGSGGGISNFESGGTPIVNLTRTRILDHTSGSGVVSFGGEVNITDSTIAGNTAANIGAGGGISNELTTLRVVGSTISGNTSPVGGGGGISNNNNATAIISNSTISGNTATDNMGGGIQNINGSTLTLINTTVVGNTGGGLLNRGTTSGPVLTSSATVNNSIIVGNDGGTGNFDVEAGVNQTFSGNNANVVGSANQSLTGITPTGIAANMVVNTTLATNMGGPTLTHLLVGGSPAINAGINADALDPIGNLLTSDQRQGFPRVQGSSVDIGSIEVDPMPSCVINSPVGSTETGDVSIDFDVNDSLNSPVTLTFEYSTDNGATFTAATAASTSPLSNPALNTATPINAGMFVWDSAADGVGNVSVEFRITVDNSVNQSTCTTVFNVANTPTTLSIDDVTLDEGNSGDTPFTLTVSLNQSALTDVTFDFNTINGTAIAGTDFTSANGQGTITAGQTSTTLTVNVTGDMTVEADETFTVMLSNPMGGTMTTIADDMGVGTITDDDSATITIGDATVVERNSGTQQAIFTVTLDNPVDAPFTVDFTTTDGTATAGSDYTASNGTLNFAGNAGEMQTISVEINGDSTFEPDEQFTVDLSNVQAGGRQIALAGSGTGTIQNDDLRPDQAAFVTNAIPPTSINGQFTTLRGGNFDGIATGGIEDDIFFWDPVSGANRILFGDTNRTLQDNAIDPTLINGNDFTEVLVDNFDGGGNTDLFFWNPSTGRNRLIHVNGGTGSVTSTFETNVIDATQINGNDFTTAIAGNFNGTEQADIFFWNPATGQNRIAPFTTVTAGVDSDVSAVQNNVIDPIQINGGDFQTVQVGNFEAGGTDELLFVNLASGNNRRVSFTAPGGNTAVDMIRNGDASLLNGSVFNTIEVADLNGDGLDDIFAWDPTSGQNRSILTDIDPAATPAFVDNAFAAGGINSDYEQVVRLIEDVFTNTPQDDLFFWNPTTGANRTGSL